MDPSLHAAREPAPVVTRLELRTPDGHRLDGWRWEVGGRPTAAVVLVHGFVGRGRSAALEEHARALVEDGYDVLVYDARGHGESGGRCTLGDAERHDVAAAVEAARRRTDHVVVVGESMGGIAALRHAAAAEDVIGVVTLGSPSFWRLTPNVPTIAAALLTRTAVGRRLAERRLGVRIEETDFAHRPGEPPAAVARRLSVPYVVVHGTGDRFLPSRNAEELHAHAGGPSRLELVVGMGHGFGRDSVAAVRDAVRWIVDHHTEDASLAG